MRLKNKQPIIEKLIAVYGDELVNPNVIRTCMKIIRERLDNELMGVHQISGEVIYRKKSQIRSGYDKREIRYLLDNVLENKS